MGRNILGVGHIDRSTSDCQTSPSRDISGGKHLGNTLPERIAPAHKWRLKRKDVRRLKLGNIHPLDIYLFILYARFVKRYSLLIKGGYLAILTLTLRINLF